jgi:hypothetical protein
VRVSEASAQVLCLYFISRQVPDNTGLLRQVLVGLESSQGGLVPKIAQVLYLGWAGYFCWKSALLFASPEKDSEPGDWDLDTGWQTSL